MSHVYSTTFDEESGNQLANDSTCPECDGQVRVESGERACEDCGLVIEDNRIDHGPEWRNFDSDEGNPSRVGSPRTRTRHDRGLSTNIGYKHDGQGQALSTKKRRRLNRQRREHSRAQFDSKQERNEMYGLSEIRRLYGALDTPEPTRERACTLFQEAQKGDLVVGRSLDAFAAGALYAACRCMGLPRQIEAFEEHARCDLQAIRNAYRVLNVELGLEVQLRSPSDFVPKFASELDLSASARREAMRLAETADGVSPGGACLSGIAAACVYVASQAHDPDPITQKEAAAAAYVSCVTVRNRRSELEELVENISG